MPEASPSRKELLEENAALQSRLLETEETLQAIRQYLVDAFTVRREDGDHVVTLNDADYPYRVMVESMNEGAITVIPDGTISYCNPRFAEMVNSQCERLIGTPFQDLIAPEQQQAFEQTFQEARRSSKREEFYFQDSAETVTPVQLSLHSLPAPEINAISILATDITERVEAARKIRSLAAKLTGAEQVERHRISQILHDDLQQRLFAVMAQLSLLVENGTNYQLPSGAKVELEQIHNWLSEAITVARNLSVDLSPPVLQGEGLPEALLWLCSHLEAQYGLQVDLSASPDFPRIEESTRVLLFQAIRELLFNVVKHADTLEAEVRLERFDNRARITVSDQGKGFDIPTVMSNTKTTHGLLIMQDRLSLMGWNVETHSEPGKGTRFVIESRLEGSFA